MITEKTKNKRKQHKNEDIELAVRRGSGEVGAGILVGFRRDSDIPWRRQQRRREVELRHEAVVVVGWSLAPAGPVPAWFSGEETFKTESLELGLIPLTAIAMATTVPDP
ncbi:hypothetical protein LXL04_026851 [Taraxacum kok-saghyz]